MNFFGLFGWKRKIRRLRRKWDRARERALKKKRPLRNIVLEKLDAIENSLRVLEERKVTHVERARLAKEVEVGLAEVIEIMKSKEGELQQYQEYITGKREG